MFSYTDRDLLPFTEITIFIYELNEFHWQKRIIHNYMDIKPKVKYFQLRGVSIMYPKKKELKPKT